MSNRLNRIASLTMWRGLGYGVRRALDRTLGPVRQQAAPLIAQAPGRWQNNQELLGAKLAAMMAPGASQQSAARLQSVMRAVQMYRDNPLYQAMISKAADYGAGAKPIRIETTSRPLQEYFDLMLDDQANSLLTTPRRDWIRFRIFAMGAYIVRVLPDGHVRLCWRNPLDFRGVTYRDGNDSLPERVWLADSTPFIEGTVEFVPSSDPGKPRRVVRVPTQYPQTIDTPGRVGAHRAIASRDAGDSMRSDADMALLGARWAPLLDGNLLYFTCNTEMEQHGAPEHECSLDDLGRLRDTVNAEVNRYQSLGDQHWNYYYRGVKSAELQKLERENWTPEPYTTNFIAMLEKPGDLADIQPVERPQEAANTDTFLKSLEAQATKASPVSPIALGAYDMNLANALSMQSPMVKGIVARQVEYERGPLMLAQYQVDTARMWCHDLPIRTAGDFTIQMPEVRIDEMSAHLTMFSQLSSAVTFLVEKGLWTVDQGQMVINEFADAKDITTLEKLAERAKIRPDATAPAGSKPVNPVAVDLGLDNATSIEEAITEAGPANARVARFANAMHDA